MPARYPPGQRWEDFRHATDELVLVLEGQMEFEIAGQGASSAGRRGAFDPSGCGTLGSKHRQIHSALAVRLQAKLMTLRGRLLMSRYQFLVGGVALWDLLGQDSVRPGAEKVAAQAALEKLQGTWYHASRHERGEEIAGEDKEILWVIRGDVFVSKQRDRVWSVGTVRIVDASSDPKKMDLVITDGANEGKTILAVYRVDGEVFQYCDCLDARPASLTTTKDDKSYTYCSTYKRLKR
jgi:uncharacterized protein (TIGR03067 family)